MGAVCAAILALGGAGAEARARHPAGGPVVVELFTAQGCATCPQANGLIGDLAAKKGVLPLTFSVDYWDYLGWTDTLAMPEFTARQRAYVQKLKVREIYTPEIVVEGAAEGSALERKTVDGLIDDAADKRRHGPRVRLHRHGTRAVVSGPVSDPRADVWLIRYDPQPQSVKIKAGENKGQTVTVRNAVRELKRLGPWNGSTKTYAIAPAKDKELKTLVIVQGAKGGRILGSARG
jgi:hypothetical protein